MHLGGSDLDQRLVDHFVAAFERRTGVTGTSANAKAMQRLRREAERVKKVLSVQTQARVDLEQLHGGADLGEGISRARFEEDLVGDLLRKALIPIDQALADAKLTRAQIDEVLLVGGSLLFFPLPFRYIIESVQRHRISSRTRGW